jgi:hypothetical protein
MTKCLVVKGSFVTIGNYWLSTPLPHSRDLHMIGNNHEEMHHVKVNMDPIHDHFVMFRVSKSRRLQFAVHECLSSFRPRVTSIG